MLKAESDLNSAFSLLVKAADKGFVRYFVRAIITMQTLTPAPPNRRARWAFVHLTLFMVLVL